MNWRTFGNGKERNWHHSISVGSPSSVMDISDWEIQRMVLHIPSCYRDSGFIRTQNDSAIHCTFCRYIFLKYFTLKLFYFILKVSFSSKKFRIQHWRTYCMPPCEISGHKLIPSSVSSLVKINVRSVIEMAIEVRIIEHVLNDYIWISKPDFVIFKLKLPARCVWSEFASIRCREVFPWYITMFDVVNCRVHVFMWRKGAEFIMLWHTKCPEIEKDVDIPRRHLFLTIKKVGR